MGDCEFLECATPPGGSGAMAAGNQTASSPDAQARCKSGKHAFSPENRTHNRHCRQCKREQERERYQRTRILKHGQLRPRWDGTVVHLFKLKWLRFEQGHWIWQHTVKKLGRRPSVGWKGLKHSPARLIWQDVGNPAIPTGYVLSRNASLCEEPLCVHPSHHRVFKRGVHLSREVRPKAPQKPYAPRAQMSLESEIASRTEPAPTACSSPAQGIDPDHPDLHDRAQWGTTAAGHSRGHRAKGPIIGAVEWPGTLWNPDTALNCRHCRRGFDYHGVSEPIANKLGVPLNRRHHVCLPDIRNPPGKSGLARERSRGRRVIRLPA